MNAQAAASVEEALSIVRNADFEQSPRILIAGSLYLAASVLALNGSRIE